MKQNITERDLAKYVKNNVEKDKMITDATGMSIVIRKCKNVASVFYYYNVVVNKKKLKYKIGEYPAMSLTEARKTYFDFVLKVQQGIEPISNGKKTIDIKEKGFRLKDLWEEYTSLHFKNIKDATQAKLLSGWNTHLVHIADMDIRQITPDFVIGFVKPHIETGKIDTAVRLASMLKSLVDYAVFKQRLPYNSISRITHYLPKQQIKHRASFKDDNLEDDLKELFKVMSDCDPCLLRLFYCYFFTLLRNVELRKLKVDEVYDGYIVIKTKTLEEFKQPLSTQARKIIQYCIDHKEHDTPYVFEGVRSSCFADATLNASLNAHGYKDRLRVHGIRTCGRQWLQTLPDVKESIIELCLSHVVGGMVAQAYNRGEYLEARRYALQKWSDFVEQCAGDYFCKILN